MRMVQNPRNGIASRSYHTRGGTVRDILIVAQDQPDLWQYLLQEFAGDEEVQVLLDRRQGERRQRVQQYESDRRGVARRRRPSTDTDLRYHPFILVLPEQRTLQS